MGNTVTHFSCAVESPTKFVGRIDRASSERAVASERAIDHARVAIRKAVHRTAIPFGVVVAKHAVDKRRVRLAAVNGPAIRLSGVVNKDTIDHYCVGVEEVCNGTAALRSITAHRTFDQQGTA